jgi:hypothetical protein
MRTAKLTFLAWAAVTACLGGAGLGCGQAPGDATSTAQTSSPLQVCAINYECFPEEIGETCGLPSLLCVQAHCGSDQHECGIWTVPTKYPYCLPSQVGWPCSGSTGGVCTYAYTGGGSAWDLNGTPEYFSAQLQDCDPTVPSPPTPVEECANVGGTCANGSYCYGATCTDSSGMTRACGVCLAPEPPCASSQVGQTCGSFGLCEGARIAGAAQNAGAAESYSYSGGTCVPYELPPVLF